VEGPSAKHTVKHLGQAIGADLISVAGHSLRLHHTPLEDHCFPWTIVHGKQEPPQELRPRNASVPSSRSSHSKRVVSENTPS